MPPQVSGPGPSKGPVVVHSQDGVNETKSKKPSVNQQSAGDSSAPHRDAAKEKSQKTLEQSMEVSSLLNKIGEALNDALGIKESSEEKTTKSKGQGGWLTDLAKALGEIENQKAEKMKEKTSR